MPSAPSVKTIVIIWLCLSTVLFTAAQAEENTLADEHAIIPATPPLLTDAEPVALNTAETGSAGSTGSSPPVPQPPLLTPPAKKTYEPPLEQTTGVNHSTEDDNIDTSRQPVADRTPQPPQIDPRVEPSYGPSTSEEVNEQESEQKTAADKPHKTTGHDQASDDITAPLTEESTKQTNWLDIRPQRVNADWLQLSSGEWLRGRIIVMQNDTLEFSSDELNNLEINWKNVKYIKSSEPYSLRFDHRVNTIGAIEITQDTVHVITDYDDQSFNRSELISIASGHETEISKWVNKITIGLNIRRGNTNQTDFNSKISAKRRTTNSRLLFDYLGNFTEVESTKTINNHRLNASYDIFMTRYLFLTPITAEFFRDPFQNIEHRANIGVAIGYTVIHTNKSEWYLSGGPAYQKTNFVSVSAGELLKYSTSTLILNTKFDTELNSKVDLEGIYSVTFGDQRTGGYTHHSILTLETELTQKFDFDVSVVWERVRNPVPDKDQITPQKDDFRILIGLGYDL